MTNNDKAAIIASAARSLANRRTDFVMPDRKADTSRNAQRGARKTTSRRTRTIL